MSLSQTGLTQEQDRTERKLTLLHKPDENWSSAEMTKLVRGLDSSYPGVEIFFKPNHPKDIILSGWYDKKEVLEIIKGPTICISQLRGSYNKKLPFIPA